VNLLQDGQEGRLGGLGHVTFSLSTQISGSLAVRLPGFVVQSSRGGELPFPGDASTDAITGTTLTSQALSLSFTTGAASGQPHGERQQVSNVRLLLAHYN
jgi:hypothetical protein